jgi:hypothetical protein
MPRPFCFGLAASKTTVTCWPSPLTSQISNDPDGIFPFSYFFPFRQSFGTIALKSFGTMVSGDFISAVIWGIFSSQVIAAASYFYHYNRIGHGWEVKIGFAPNDPGGFVNAEWFESYSIFALGLFSLVLAVSGFGILLAEDWFLDRMHIFGIVFILKGLATLGTSNDLGVAAGSIEIGMGIGFLPFACMRREDMTFSSS